MPVKFYKIYDFLLDGTEPQPLNIPRTIEVEGKLICMVRLEDGYFAVNNRCPHAGGHLGSGKCDENGYIICPIHRHRFNMRSGKGLAQQGDYVDTYPVEIKSDGVYVGFEKKWWQFW